MAASRGCTQKSPFGAEYQAGIRRGSVIRRCAEVVQDCFGLSNRHSVDGQQGDAQNNYGRYSHIYGPPLGSKGSAAILEKGITPRAARIPRSAEGVKMNNLAT